MAKMKQIAPGVIVPADFELEYEICPPGGYPAGYQSASTPPGVDSMKRVTEAMDLVAQAEAKAAAPWEVVKGIAGIGAKVPDPLTQLVSGLVGAVTGIFQGLFADKPCKPNSTCPIDKRWTSPNWFVITNGNCCRPALTGRGVAIADHEFGYKKWPGSLTELPAGDYRHSCGRLQQGPQANDTIDSIERDFTNIVGGRRLLCNPGEGGTSSIMVPDGWKVRLYRDPDAKSGSYIDLGPGSHNLKPLGWNDWAQSFRVRGWWTISDTIAMHFLAKRAKGWYTENWPQPPTEAELIGLILQDPCREPAPESFEVDIDWYRPSFWRPGWEIRMSELKRGIEAFNKFTAAERRKEAIMKAIRYAAPIVAIGALGLGVSRMSRKGK